jgi:MurNAc alpha-1-phosphate uridylyltransferase
MSELGSRAMILAAGMGVRMRPLTDSKPKPLIEVNGQPLIDYAVDRLRSAGCRRAVVNAHHFSEQIEGWAGAQRNPSIVVSDERSELLDTGGGIARALPLLGGDPFFVLNSDSLWLEGARPALDRLRAAWKDDVMDCVLLLCETARAIGYAGQGDFVWGSDGRLSRRPSGDQDALVYIGCYLVHPRLFRGAPKGKFSMNVLWNKAIAEGRLFGIAHDALWLHVGTPEAIPLAERALRR